MSQGSRHAAWNQCEQGMIKGGILPFGWISVSFPAAAAAVVHVGCSLRLSRQIAQISSLLLPPALDGHDPVPHPALLLDRSLVRLEAERGWQCDSTISHTPGWHVPFRRR